MSFPSSIFETRGLVKLGRLSGEDLYFFVVDQLGCKTISLCYNGIGGRHVHRCKEVNESKNLGYAISLLVFFLDSSASPWP